jgi:Ca2+-binding RTX toxin-like protein
MERSMARLVVDLDFVLRMDLLSAFDLGFGDDAEHVFYVDGFGDRILTEIDYLGAATSFNLSGLSVDYDYFLNLADDGNDDLVLATLLRGNDDIDGNIYDDYLEGFGGDDIIDGHDGEDTMVGGAGNDLYYVDDFYDEAIEAWGEGNDWVYTSTSYTLAAGSSIEGLAAADGRSTAALFLTGNAFANTITGNAGANTIKGMAGDDFLVGGGGNDMLSGGSGRDVFLFSSALSRTRNADKIADFSVPSDTIELENAVFKALKKTGYLSSGNFRTGTAARDGNDHIIYNKAAGVLSYDPDGVGGASATKFATVTPYLALTAKDFYVI